ncbi:MAG: PKD domain-containing protein [Bacteroidetes bacterium]|nr:PKD domain-containing protein [Bacteroidota bacterium]
MRKFTKIICGILMIFSTEKNLAQCPPNSFTSSDTVCPLQNINIDNSLSTASSFNWDFCLGDLDSLPTAVALPLIGGTLSYPINMKMIEVNGNHYGFIVNSFGGNYITRYDFGNSPANPPTATNLNSDPLLGFNTSGIDIVKEGTKWYMFITASSSNSLLRYEMDSITQINPILINLNLPGLSGPSSIKVIYDYAFITNNSSAEITRINFGGNYSNTPTSLTPIPTGVFNNFGIDVAFDCVSNKYIGYTTSSAFGLLSKIDFGNSLANTPTFSTAMSSIWTALGLQVIQEEGNWHLFIVSENNNFYHYKMGNSLDLPLTLDYSTNFGGIMNNPQNIQMTKVGSDWVGIIPNRLLFSIVRLQFPQGCSSAAVSSTLQSPTGISFTPSQLGYNLFELKETLANGTTQLYLDSVYVQIPPPESNFNMSSGCINSPVQFTDLSNICYGSINTWSWDFGDGNFSNQASPSHEYGTTGSFNVVLKVYSTNGDSATSQQNIIIHELPIAWFTVADSACVGSDVILTDSSTSNDGALQQWEWMYGDGNFGSGITSTHSYNASGTYSIQLISSTIYGCSDTISRNIEINPGPISNFEIYNTCAGETAQFINTTTAIGTSILSTFWEFGDGNNSSQINTSHSYTNTANNYNIILVSTAINGCTDTIQRNIRIGNKPLPWFSMSSDTACTFSTIIFTDSSFAGIGDTINKRIWNFGDGIIDSTTTSPNHTYTIAGNYLITLTIQSPENCDSIISRNIFIIESPTSNFSVTNVCKGSLSNFVDLSTAPSGSIITDWAWDFGDTNTSILSSPTHTYADTGYYSVTLIVKSDIGCYDTTTINTQVYSLPNAWFNFGLACTDSPLQFTDSSTVTGSTISNWNWTFGVNGTVDTLPNPSYLYQDALAYPVTLIATTAQGCADTAIRIAIINQSPEFTITSPDHCYGTNNQFIATPSAGSTSTYSYIWNFGDSAASFLPQPTHTYSNQGNYQITFLVTDINNGCTAEVNDTLTVYTLPNAGFTYSNTCVGDAVSFIDTSTSVDGIISNWNWTLGTNGNSTTQNPLSTFSSSGTQNIKLVIQTSYGCSDSITKSITIHSLPLASITATPYYGAPPLAVQFINNSDSGSYLWQFGDGSPNSTGQSPIHLFNDTGLYHTTFSVTNQFGCIQNATINIYVQIPNRDLSIHGVSFNKINNKWIMKAIVANFGNEDANEFELKGTLSGENIFYNTFLFDTLKVGNSKEYTFNTSFESGTQTPPYFCAEVISINSLADMNASNDRFCRSSSSSFEIFNVYPNPFTDQIYIGINMIQKGEISLSLININGGIIFENQTHPLDEGLNTLSIPLDHLAKAVYFLKVNYQETNQYFKLVRD